MPVTIVATPGASNANSYTTLAAAEAYFESRIGIPAWTEATNDQKNALLVMATRVLDAFGQPFKWIVNCGDGCSAHYRVRRQWTGTPTTTTQVLSWPRTGMFDRNGNAIGTMVIPQDLKNAQAELAGQLATADRTLDNDIVAYGIKSIRAGSVALSFKDMVEAKVIPDAVWNLMPASWFTDELMFPVLQAQFDVVSE